MNWKKAAEIGAAGFLISGLPWKIDITEYEIHTVHIRRDTKICILADLHSTMFGKGQQQLKDRIRKIDPDLVLMAGDMIDERKESAPAFALFDGLRKYETFYVPGNHEMRMDDEDLRMYLSRMEEMGIHVLIDETVYDRDRGIEIAGLHSMPHHVDCTERFVSSLFHHDDYRILMSHRPCFASFYEKVQCDLVVCGHAHGGQWRIPFTHQGLYAPQEGILPKYTEGLIDLGSKKMCISRGLNRSAYGIPRLFNNPEIVVLKLVKEEEK
jgi:predicted MPP superfamily phosphohydrolase